VSVYNKRFFDMQSEGSAASAAKVVPTIVDLIEPKTVLDVGCGRGFWCNAFENKGVKAYGLDGPWSKDGFQGPKDQFIAFDVLGSNPPFRPNLPIPKFDLVTTFEFLEHIDPPKAEPIVDLITSVTDVVVAGASPPGQGGTHAGHHHVNEQWPDYWQDLFAKKGFVAFDFLRPIIWNLEGVEPFYIMNPIGYFRGGPSEKVVAAAEAAALANLRNPLGLVHPGMFLRKVGLLEAQPTMVAKKFVRGVLGRS